MEFNFRINREWKDRTEKPNKILKHCPVVNPNPELSDDIMHVIQIFHHEQMPPLQQLEIMASVFVKVMQLKFECFPTIGDRRLRKFGTMMNSILRTDRVSGTFCPNGGSHWKFQKLFNNVAYLNKVLSFLRISPFPHCIIVNKVC